MGGKEGGIAEAVGWGGGSKSRFFKYIIQSLLKQHVEEYGSCVLS